MQKNRKDWIPIAVLGAAVVVLFYRLLLGEVIFWGTPLLQFIPWRSFAFDAIKSGQSPLWNPYAGFGAPLLANYQTGVFYPPNWLYLIVPVAYANGLIGVLHVIWAGFGMRALLRRWEVSRFGQGVGMIAYALGGFLIARFGILPILCTASWLPWLLASVDALLHAERGSWQSFNGIVQLSAVAALMLLAGHAQLSFYSLLLAGCYALWVFFTQDGDRRQAGRALLLALLAVVIGIGLAAVQLIPTFELVRTSHRAVGVDRYTSLSYSFWPWHFLTFLMPNLFGSPAVGDYVGYGAYWEDAVFVGLLTLYFAVVAFVRFWRSRKDEEQRSTTAGVVPFFAASLLPVLIFALGWNTPIFPWLFDHVPTFDLFNGPTRWMVLAVFALSVLGGIGADLWRGTVKVRSWAKRLIVAGLAMVIAVLAASAVVGESIKPHFILAFVRFGLSLAALGGLILLYRQMAAAKHITAWELLVMLCLAADLVSAHWGLNPTLPVEVINTRSPLADLVPPGTRIAYLPADEDRVKYEQYFTFDDFHSGDIEHWENLRISLLPNLFMLDGLSSINNFDPLLVGHYANAMDELDNLPPGEQIERLAEYNVSVLLTPNPRDDLDLLAQAGETYAYQTPSVPRATFESCEPADGGVICQPLTSGLVFPAIDEPTHLSFDVVAPMSGWLLLRDTYYPGWDAFVDDVYVETVRANGNFRAVEVPEGTHTVEFEYQPVSVRLGWMIGGASLCVWGIVWTMGLTRRQNEDQSGGGDEG